MKYKNRASVDIDPLVAGSPGKVLSMVFAKAKSLGLRLRVAKMDGNKSNATLPSSNKRTLAVVVLDGMVTEAWVEQPTFRD